jgi:hypothetical protein
MLETCPKCGLARFKAYGKSNVAVKTIWHFPLVLRLLRMFRVQKIAELMTWHSQKKSKDGKVCHVHVSKAWAHIDRIWPEFRWRTPKLLDRVKCESEAKTTEEQGVGARSLARSTLGVEGCAGAPRWD